MSHRLLGSLAILGVLLLPTGRTASASATSATTSAKPVSFRLTNTTASPVSEMYFELVPKDTIIPPILGTDDDGNVLEGSPMKALPSSTGIDILNSYVLLTNDPDNDDMQRMFLLFGYEPETDPSAAVPFRPLLDDAGNRVGELAPGGQFDFELNLAQDAIGMLLRSAVDGLTLSLRDVPKPDPEPQEPGNGGIDPGTDPTIPIPEPSAVVLWSAIGVAGLAAARRRRARSSRVIS